MLKRLTLLVVGLLLFSTDLSAQEPFNIAIRVDKLASLFTQLYGRDGLIVDSRATLPSGEDHSAHFDSAFQTEFVQFGAALTGKLVSVPLPSLASGFTYEFDPSLGVFSRSTQSFGPIMAERAETIGANRTSFGVAFEHSGFDTIEGLNLDKVPGVFTHDDFELREGREDLVTTRNSIDASVDQFTAFVTYGLTDRLDVSLAVPFVSTELLVVSEATIQRIGTENPEVHFYQMADGTLGDRRIFTAFGSARGIGDLTIRLKGRLWKGATSGVALGLDLRVPSGDEENLLGAGAPGVKPFVAWSASYDTFSPTLISATSGTGPASSPATQSPSSRLTSPTSSRTSSAPNLVYPRGLRSRSTCWASTSLTRRVSCDRTSALRTASRSSLTSRSGTSRSVKPMRRSG